MPFELTEQAWETLWDEAKHRGNASRFDSETEIVDRATLSHIGQFYQCDIPLQGLCRKKW
jgi:hypothetical protein